VTQSAHNRGSWAESWLALKSGFIYFGITFTVGFVLGIARVAGVEPVTGPTIAVAIEVPIMIAASWIICGWLTYRLRVAPTLNSRLSMGSVGLGFLAVAELGISNIVLDRTFEEQLGHYRTTPGIIGLVGQLAFAAMPTLHLIMPKGKFSN
jgi:hypothetical protein